LIAAIGIVQIFGNVNTQVVQTSKDAQANIVGERIKNVIVHMNSLSGPDRGYMEVELPENIGGQDYDISLEEGRVILLTGAEEYEKRFNIAEPNEDFSGTVEGGDVRIYKNSRGYELRAGR